MLTTRRRLAVARRRPLEQVVAEEPLPDMLIPRKLFEPPAEFFAKGEARREWLAERGVRGFLAINAAERAAIRVHGIEVPDSREWFHQLIER